MIRREGLKNWKGYLEMITQLDNVLEPLLEKSRHAIGLAPSVDIHYIDKDHVDVYLTGYNIRVSHTYNSLLEGIEKQFVEFISEIQEIMRRENSQYRTASEIYDELNEILDEPQRHIWNREWNGRITIDEPGRIINWRELEW